MYYAKRAPIAALQAELFVVETSRNWQLWQLYARSALSGAFSSFASVLCNTLANKQKTWRLGIGL